MDRSIRSSYDLGPHTVRNDSPTARHEKSVLHSHPNSNVVTSPVERSSHRVLPVLLLAFALSGVAQHFYSPGPREDSFLFLTGVLILLVLAGFCFAALRGKDQVETRDGLDSEARGHPGNSGHRPRPTLSDPSDPSDPSEPSA